MHIYMYLPLHKMLNSRFKKILCFQFCIVHIASEDLVIVIIKKKVSNEGKKHI